MKFKVLGYNKETEIHRVSDVNDSLLNIKLNFLFHQQDKLEFLFDSKSCKGTILEILELFPKEDFYLVTKFEVIEKETELTNKEKFFGIISLTPNGTADKIKASIENRYWLAYSRNIAFLAIKELEKKKLSQEEFSKLMEISLEDSQNLLTGRFDLTLSVLCKLQEVLDISILTKNNYNL